MPKLDNLENVCYLCGGQAFFISVNSKRMRCTEKITQCPGFVKKAEEARRKNISPEERQDHMKKMSNKGNSVLKTLHTNNEWVREKGNKISAKVKDRGGHFGSSNPMFGKNHNNESKKKMSEKANKRNPECYMKASETKINQGIAVPKHQKTNWELYKEQVLNYTYKSWQHYHDKINPFNLERGPKYELDHKFSILEGFKQGVDPKIIGSYVNLEVIPKFKNRSKRVKCSITLEELILAYIQ